MKIFDVDFRVGSLLDKVSGVKGTNANGFRLIESEKGKALNLNNETLVPVVHDIDLNIGTNSAFSFVTAIKFRGYLNHGSAWNILSGYGSPLSD